MKLTKKGFICVILAVCIIACMPVSAGTLSNTYTIDSISYDEGLKANVTVKGTIKASSVLTAIMYDAYGAMLEKHILDASGNAVFNFASSGKYVKVFMYNKNNLKPLSAVQSADNPYFVYLPENISIVANIEKIVTKLGSIKFTGVEIKITSIIKETMNATKEDAKTTYIDEDYVTRVYGDKVTEAKTLYNSLDDTARGMYRSKIARIDEKTLNYLNEYFFK